MKRTSAILTIISIMAVACSTQSVEKFNYPESKKINVQDDYFGQVVGDPYRWLENDTSAETGEWVKAQNEVTFGYLDQIPFRGAIRNRLEELVNYPRMSAPIKAGNRFFVYRNNGLQNQDVIYIKDGMDGEERIFLDPNEYSEGGTVTMSIAGISEDDSLLVISKSEAGSDWREFIVFDIATMQSIGDTLRWVKFSNAKWHGNGFFYSRYPASEEGLDYSSSNKFHSVYFHKVGEPQENDELIYQDKEHENRYHYVGITEDHKYLILYIAEGTDGYECHYRALDSDEKDFTPLFTGFKHKSSVVDHMDGKFLVRTDIQAPFYRLVSIDLQNPDRENWVQVIPEKKKLLRSVSTAGGYLFANYLQNAQSVIFRHDYNGENQTAIELPGLGTVNGFGGEREDSIVFYSFSSFTYPGNIFSYNLKSNESALYFQPELQFDPELFESKQTFYKTKDGTPVSIFIVNKKGVELNGQNSTLLYGYGGFNISITPRFNKYIIPWLEAGGVYAVANLRGGGEYGEEWHQAGMLLNKQNVFDDFIAAAEYLIDENYTSKDRLVISGRSNGGLLVGAVMTQRPDLFQVALPGVGVMDMLRYHKFTVGHGWIPEYGSSEEEEHFKNLISFSPLHNLRPDTDYPATLVYTGDHDDRVVPAHSFKFAATLQEMHTGDRPVLIRIETDAGHGSGKPIAKILDEEADKLAFSLYNTGGSYPVK